MNYPHLSVVIQNINVEIIYTKNLWVIATAL